MAKERNKALFIMLKDSWIVQTNFVPNTGNDEFEGHLCTLRSAAAHGIDRAVTTQIRELEGLAMATTNCPSLQQQARFFFFGGEMYTKAGYCRAAYQYYEMCQRRIAANDSKALFMLHQALGPAAAALSRPLTALHSYQMMLWLLQESEASLPVGQLEQHYHHLIEQCRSSLANSALPLAATPKMGSRVDVPDLQ